MDFVQYVEIKDEQLASLNWSLYHLCLRTNELQSQSYGSLCKLLKRSLAIPTEGPAVIEISGLAVWNEATLVYSQSYKEYLPDCILNPKKSFISILLPCLQHKYLIHSKR